MRRRVNDVLDLCAAGLSIAEVLAEMPDLDAADIAGCLRFASRRLDRPVLAAPRWQWPGTMRWCPHTLTAHSTADMPSTSTAVLRNLLVLVLTVRRRLLEDHSDGTLAHVGGETGRSGPGSPSHGMDLPQTRGDSASQRAATTRGHQRNSTLVTAS